LTNQKRESLTGAGAGGQRDLGRLFGESLKFFDDVVVREEIYRLHLKRVMILDEIEKLSEIKSEYEMKAARRTKVYFVSAFVLFAAQFGISFHCIYNVEWLGWDLVEPITYSVA
jgi:hypothetical protein